MFKSHIEIFSDDSLYNVQEQANSYAEKHNAEIVSADLNIRGESLFVRYHLTVVFKETKRI